MTAADRPWRTLWVVLFGLFMILLDATIVSVANPAIKSAFGSDFSAVVWVTSAYLLGYAVPLLITGRLGDQYGPRAMYLIGLAVFTAASLWCGLAGTIGMLIAARVVQGVGAALLTPQTLTLVQRVFPPERRGAAMGVWGAVAGVATLVGPIAGGVLVDGWGWQWIFFVNVPVGLLGLVLGAMFIPHLQTHPHRLDLLGMLLSAVGMFAFVFALQEGQRYHWGVGVWAILAVGVVVLGLFVWWQAVNPGEPLIPLRLFADRNFSLSGIAIATMGFATIGGALPMMFYTQLALGFSPTRAALTQAPTAVLSGLLAPVAGMLVNRVRPAVLIGGGISLMALSTLWWAAEMKPGTQMWQLMAPSAGVGVAMACTWGPLATTATRNLSGPVAGAGSGVYNTLRQVGGVMGSAGIGALMTARLAAEMPYGVDGSAAAQEGALPDFLRGPFSTAMGQSMLLGVAVLAVGVVAALFMRRPSGVGAVSLDDEVSVEHQYLVD